MCELRAKTSCIPEDEKAFQDCDEDWYRHEEHVQNPRRDHEQPPRFDTNCVVGLRVQSSSFSKGAIVSLRDGYMGQDRPWHFDTGHRTDDPIRTHRV